MVGELCCSCDTKIDLHGSALYFLGGTTVHKSRFLCVREYVLTDPTPDRSSASGTWTPHTDHEADLAMAGSSSTAQGTRYPTVERQRARASAAARGFRALSCDGANLYFIGQCRAAFSVNLAA